ncbi:MAG: HD domain-containing protein [Ruminiclostridium sp.]|nr:HD domain-containing protein [Ruminiclostridium sp.]
MVKHNRTKHFFGLLLSLAMLIGTLGTGAAAEEYPINSSGVPNRNISVDPTGLSEGFSAVLYDNTNGLPTSEANAIAETSDGFIWIGSYAGLIRYDGNTFERMDPSGGLTSIKCLYADSRDRLWIGTNDNGVAVMDKGGFRIWNKMDGMVSSHTRAIAEDNSGNIYVATAGGIMMFDPDLNLTALRDEEIAEANMRDIRLGIDGQIYGTTDGGDLLTIRDGKLTRFISAEANPLKGAGAILPSPTEPGRLYQEAADLGFYYIDISSGYDVIDKIDIAPLNYLKSVEYIDGKLWICATNGIGVVEDGKFRLLENLPMDNNVCHVMTDYLGNLWFASTRQGVMKVVPNQFADIFERFDLPEAVVNSTCRSGGNLFVATDTGLTVIDENGPLSEFPLTKAETVSGTDLGEKDLIKLLEGCRIRSVIRDSKERIWISTWRKYGLLCLDNGGLTAFTEEDGLLSTSLRSVSECGDGRILVALTGGVNVIENGKVTASYGKEDGIENTESLTVEEGLNGEIILGSNGGGLYIIDDSGVHNINVEQGLPSDIVMRLKRDTDNDVVWIVTSSDIAYLTPDYRVVRIKNFPYPNNFDIHKNSHDEIWVLSSNGIYVLPAASLLANGDIAPVFYSIANGLPCISTANSYSELTDDGDLYIAGTTGVAKVNIDRSFENVNDLKAVISWIEADGEIIYPDSAGVFNVESSTQKITIPGFVFNYSLTDPQVSYQLEGFDRESVTLSRSELVPVDYTNLRGGEYRFVLNVKDAMGRGNKEVSVRIVKARAFYEEWWFYLICALLGIFIIAEFVRLYLRKKTRRFREREEEQRRLFDQTATALVNAIDAKDRYTHGHSARVADYSRKIAELAGKSEKECEDVYYAALLHDVGKIGVPGSIINKDGKLTDEEYAIIKQHPTKGVQILSSITEFPYLSVGAHYHHERYDGRGYPEGLKGEEIPEIARMISVADAYDAMTSKRSYRDPIPQQKVREEIVKGSGTQFDPVFAGYMLHLIDLDTEYLMQERDDTQQNSGISDISVGEYRSSVSEGILVTRFMTTVTMSVASDEEATGIPPEPAMILFDSLDGKVHSSEREIRDLLYFEYGEIGFDGRAVTVGARKIQADVSETVSGDIGKNGDYRIEAVRIKDHALIRVIGKKNTVKVIIALPDSSRYMHIGLTGKHCRYFDIKTEKAETAAPADFIPRIAEEISYINVPAGDIPNVQVDDYRSAHSEGIEIRDGLTIKFHAKSLPTARLVWHCPYIDIFSSADGAVGGSTYRDIAFMRFDGEFWESDPSCHADVNITKTEEFGGWEAWKKFNRDGYDTSVTFRVENNSITIITENAGIAIRNTAVLNETDKTIYAALTGDQCALTDIRISYSE